LLALGTTGEGILLSVAERRRVAELFIEAAAGRLQVAVHCGAQTTVDTVALAYHAAGLGVAGVAVIAPPYFALDDEALLEHFGAAALACAPTPFYVYEFARTSGYAVPPHVVEALRERAPNLAGLKVSDAPWDRFQPYLIEGLDIFVGPEALITQGMEAGAVGAVSALGTAFPELVAACVREPTAE
jgi:dihydrodipicolinate synthase/N-acetylneuraminate lyase